MSANNEDLKKVTQRRRPHGPGARMMPGEKAKDFKGSISKLVRFMGQFKAALVLAITFANKLFISSTEVLFVNASKSE